MSFWEIAVALLSCYISLASSKNPQMAQISQMLADSEVFQGDGIHIQCLVRYDPKAEEITVELTRTLANTSETQALSSNGKVLLKEPQGQKYDAYVAQANPRAKEHAFKITNIDILQDSGVYRCLVKHRGRVIDRKEAQVQVYEDYEDYAAASGSDPEYFNRASSSIKALELETDISTQQLKNTVHNGLKCSTGEKQVDLEKPVVCHPNLKKVEGEIRVPQELGLSASLPCIAEALPPPKVEWFKNNTGEEVKVHSNSQASINIDEFGDSFMAVSLVIHSVKKEDYGAYFCVATNGKGDKDSMKIILEAKTASAASGLVKMNYLTSFLVVLLLSS